MNRKIIAVDLDQTLSHTLDSLVAWHNETYNTNLSVTDFNTYDYWKIWGGTRQESYYKIREFYNSIHFDTIKPIQDFALEALKMLKSRHFQLVIITSRQQFVAEKTKKFVDKHYPGIFDSIYFCNLDLSDNEQLEYVSKQKSIICQEIGVDVFIDDSLNHVLDCSSLGIQVLLFDYYGNYQWNQSKKLSYNITRVHHWRDIIAQFPKPSSPLKYCCYTINYYDSSEEEESSSQDDDVFDNPSNYYTYETIEVEEEE